MGLRDEIRKSARNAGRLGRDSVVGSFEAFNAWSDRRTASRRLNEIDRDLNKAAATAVKRGFDGNHEPARDPKAMHFNPFDLVAAMNYRDRPSGLTYQAMEMVGRGVPVVSDVINVRVNQVGTFCQLPEGPYAPGFKVRHRDWRTKMPTKAQRKRIEELEQVALHTGYHDPDDPADSTSLLEFAKVFVYDSLQYDQGNFEVVPDRKGRPSYITTVDPSTIRLLDPGTRDPGDAYAVQVINGSIVTDFTHEELAFCIRNPRSGIRSYGYGTSEIETLVREVTGFLWSMDYNRKFFVQGSATKGVLNFKGTIPDRHLQAFRRQWYAMVSGVTNAWRTPITNAEELQWINMQLSNRDMEYSAWMDFLIKIVCARYLIAPEEVNFSYGNTGQSQAMGTAPIEEKLKASKDLGLRPLVWWFFKQLNEHFIQRIDPDFEVVPSGLDEQGEEAEAGLLDKQTKVFMTINEARERSALDLPPLSEDQGGNVIRDPTWLQFVQGQQGMDEEGGFGGDEGDEGEEPPPDADISMDEESDPNDNIDMGESDALKSDAGTTPSIVRYQVDLK